MSIWAVGLYDGLRVNIEFEVSVNPVPGSTSGPPEDCYPAEPGELEIIDVTEIDTGFYVDSDFWDQILNENQETLWEAARELANEGCPPERRNQ